MTCSPWATVSDLNACCESTASDAQKTSALDSASEVLYMLSGTQFPGACEETLRPCSGGSALPGFSWSRWTFPWVPVKNGSQWLNIGPACGCHIAYDCACNGIPQVDLGRRDVTDIISVTIDGALLSSSSYRLDHGGLLVRTDGEMWPCCQDLSKDIGETGTWSINVEYGLAPPQVGVDAAVELACEIAKACVGEDCRLPPNVQSLSRQGVNLVMMNPGDLESLPLTSMFLQAYNPSKLTRRASVWSPEVKGKRRTVGSLGS